MHADSLFIDATTPDSLGSFFTGLTASSLARRYGSPPYASLAPAYDPADVALGEAGTIEISARAVGLENGGSIADDVHAQLRLSQYRFVVSDHIRYDAG